MAWGDEVDRVPIFMAGCLTVGTVVGLMVLAFCMGRYLFPSGS